MATEVKAICEVCGGTKRPYYNAAGDDLTGPLVCTSCGYQAPETVAAARPDPLPHGVLEAEGRQRFALPFLLAAAPACPCECHRQQSPSLRAVTSCCWCTPGCQAETTYWRELAKGVGCDRCSGTPGMLIAVRNAVLQSRERSLPGSGNGHAAVIGVDDAGAAIRGALALREKEIAGDLAAALAFADADTAEYDVAYSRAKGGVEEIIRRLRGQS